MTVIARITLPAESFALAEALSAAPEMRVEPDRIAAHSPNATMPCLWASGGDFAAFEDGLERDPTVDEVRDTADFDGERLYHVTWTDEIHRFVVDVVDHEGSIVEATAREDRWRLRIRFTSREQFETFQAFADETELPFTLEQLFNTERPHQRYGAVTPDQFEALVLAASAGYFRVPREATAENLAAELDITPQSFSERLRRGIENLVRDALVVDLDAEDSLPT